MPCDGYGRDKGGRILDFADIRPVGWSEARSYTTERILRVCRIGMPKYTWKVLNHSSANGSNRGLLSIQGAGGG